DFRTIRPVDGLGGAPPRRPGRGADSCADVARGDAVRTRAARGLSRPVHPAARGRVSRLRDQQRAGAVQRPDGGQPRPGAVDAAARRGAAGTAARRDADAARLGEARAYMGARGAGDRAGLRALLHRALRPDGAAVRRRSDRDRPARAVRIDGHGAAGLPDEPGRHDRREPVPRRGRRAVPLLQERRQPPVRAQADGDMGAAHVGGRAVAAGHARVHVAQRQALGGARRRGPGDDHRGRLLPAILLVQRLRMAADAARVRLRHGLRAVPRAAGPVRRRARQPDPEQPVRRGGMRQRARAPRDPGGGRPRVHRLSRLGRDRRLPPARPRPPHVHRAADVAERPAGDRPDPAAGRAPL
ncbi:MAG: GH43_30 / GH43 / GH43_8 / GH43_3 / GH43_ 31 / GH43_33 / GH43_34 / GH43_32 / GH43_5 / GH43 _12 / GH43_9, partial [uncultured Sphingomonadaceae bacterium]